MAATWSIILRTSRRANPIIFVVSVACAVVLLLAVAGPARAEDLWSDISDDQWVRDYGVTALEADIVADGYPDGTFHPYASVTRGQFAKMAVNGLDVPLADPIVPTYSDVPSSHRFYLFIEGGHEADIIGGYPDGTYRPDSQIVRQQANSILGKFLSRAEISTYGGIQGDFMMYPSLAAWYFAEGDFYLGGYEDEGQVSSVHRPAVAYLVYREVVKGSHGTLTPLSPLSRAQAVALVLRTLDVAGDVTTPPNAPRDMEVLPSGPSNNPRPYVIGRTFPQARVFIYDTFGQSTTEIAEGTADAQGQFSIRTPTLAEGPHEFTAKVKDGTGPFSDASESVLYVLDETPPVGAISVPDANAAVSSLKPDFTIDASDEGAGIAGVYFEYRPAGSGAAYSLISMDDTALGMEYRAVWGDRSLSDGSYEFRAQILDKAGNSSIVSAIQVLVDLQVPTVELQAPAAADVFYDDTGTPDFRAAAADAAALPDVEPSGVERVDFLYKLHNAATYGLLSSDDSAEYSADWSGVFLADGDYDLAVRSVDRAGNQSALAGQRVIVDTQAPIISLVAPAAGASVPDNTVLMLAWSITDVSGVDTVNVEYSPTGGEPWTLIAAAADADAPFAWAVPDVVGTEVPSFKLRLTAVDRAAGPLGDEGGHTTVYVSGDFTVREAPAAPTGVSATDLDTNPGVDGRDFSVIWTPSASTDVIRQDIYLLPVGTPLVLGGPHTPVVWIGNNTVAAWTGTSSVTADSAGAAFDDDSHYHVYVVAVDGAGGVTASTPALWSAVEGVG